MFKIIFAQIGLFPSEDLFFNRGHEIPIKSLIRSFYTRGHVFIRGDNHNIIIIVEDKPLDIVVIIVLDCSRDNVVCY